MTIDTIKNVLMRILSINKNLNEGSLRNLLVASAWDESDIKEGLSIFRAYKLSGGDSDSVSDYNNIPKAELSPDSIKEEAKPEAQIVNTPKKVIDYKMLDHKVPENFILDINMSKQDSQTDAKTESTLDPKKDISNITPQDTKNIPVVKTSADQVAHQSHIDTAEIDAYNKREGKPMFLIILDVVLFLITLGLLIYILLS
jgi:hypothetical protein